MRVTGILPSQNTEQKKFSVFFTTGSQKKVSDTFPPDIPRTRSTYSSPRGSQASPEGMLLTPRRRAACIPENFCGLPWGHVKGTRATRCRNHSPETSCRHLPDHRGHSLNTLWGASKPFPVIIISRKTAKIRSRREKIIFRLSLLRRVLQISPLQVPSPGTEGRSLERVSSCLMCRRVEYATPEPAMGSGGTRFQGAENMFLMDTQRGFRGAATCSWSTVSYRVSESAHGRMPLSIQSGRCLQAR